jgi:penicillin-binding protein 1A
MEEADKDNQRYPTYTHKNRDVVLKEFEYAHSAASGQYRYLQYVIGILVAAVTSVTSVMLGTDKKALVIGVPAFILFFGVSYIILRYVAELQKHLVINSRKVVVLRQMLGLDYGKTRLVLPNWRFEGATEPFAIKMFPGWGLKYPIALSLWAVLLAGNLALFCFAEPDFWLIFMILYSTLLMLSFRRTLYDNSENNYLLFAGFLSVLIRVRLVDNVEYIVYRARLAVAEMHRLDFNLDNIKGILIKVEDDSFLEHKGINLRSLFRGIVSNVLMIRNRLNILKSGGSTINMQLARTLFINGDDYNKKIRRKVLEIILAKWINKEFSKTEILEFYLASVRFSRNIMGMPAASFYFFRNSNKKVFSNEEALFLIERISSASATYRQNRVHYLAKKVDCCEVDASKLDDLYKKLKSEGILS